MLATYETASNPEEHNLLIATAHVVSGNPAIKDAILIYATPEPIYRTFPIVISSTRFGFTTVAAFYNNGSNSISHEVSFNPPSF